MVFSPLEPPTRTWAARQHRRPADSAPPADADSSLPRPSQGPNPRGPGLPGPPPASPSPPGALPLIGAKVIVQPVFKSFVRGGGGVPQLARGSAMEGQKSERPTGGGHTPTGPRGSLGGAVTPTCSHPAPPKLGAEGGPGLGSAAEAGKRPGGGGRCSLVGTGGHSSSTPAHACREATGVAAKASARQGSGALPTGISPHKGEEEGRAAGHPWCQQGALSETGHPGTPASNPQEDTGCPPGGWVTPGTWAALRQDRRRTQHWVLQRCRVLGAQI